jgi:sugar/nucleoside kinase (ribokinase family)
MDGKYTPDSRSSLPVPEVVVVGAASRDIAADDPRGWRLGGGVSYSSLTVARLGLSVGALVGLDEAASGATELDLLRDAGVDVRAVPLDSGPVFLNVERPEGRHQLAHARSDPLAVTSVPSEWHGAAGWILAPVAAELPEAWAEVPASDATVAVGWQGLLRALEPGKPVRHLEPRREPILERADLVGLSRDDVEPGIPMRDLYALLRPGATLAMTQGDRGGLVIDGIEDGVLRLRHYPAVHSNAIVDPTGAGDVFLAALAAVRIQPRLVGGRIGQGMDLLVAAAAASLVLEGPGLLGVPDRFTVRDRVTATRRRVVS